MNLLVVEDDPRVADFLARGLRAEGYLITVARTGPEGLELGRSQPFDLILLDLMLPGLSGLEVCQELRARQVLTPILMLTALDTTEDKIKGLRLGADDYLIKPFDVDELLARIEALIRRNRGFTADSRQLVVGDLVFDRETLTVRRGAHPIELTAKELALLELLMSAPGKVFSRERILNRVWGYAEDPLTNVVDVYIRRLRGKIDDGHTLPLIKTLRGIGYKLDPSAG
ncbi:MAG TPA: response regulator transcription factor [Candidatus Competibacteraceae bacterium]|nr:response regulator transcription factor [Candidatus Competibacteraceae bacterium]